VFSSSLPSSQAKEMRKKRQEGVLIKDLKKEYNLSKASVYRYLGNQTEKN
jgi:Mor family transcriptional regulator